MRSHGTRSCYLGGCRCEPCVEATRAYGREYWMKYRRHIEGTPLVPAGPVVEHINKLRARGMGYRTIAKAAGLSLTAVQQAKRRQSVLPRTAKAILAVQPAPYLVPSLGHTRRVRALSRMGWTQQQIADSAGLDRKVVGQLMSASLSRCQAESAEAVRAVFERLQMKPGPSPLAAQRAEAKGWAPPLAWDPDTIDDPRGRPTYGERRVNTVAVDEAAVQRRIDGDRTVPLNNAERREVVRRLHAQRLTDLEIRDRTGIDDRQVVRERQRLGLASNVSRGQNARYMGGAA